MWPGSLGVGGGIGAVLAKRMAITELPQMVAAFHSLVGLAAVTTSIASYMAHPEAADAVHLVSTFLGTFIGAVTLTGTCPSSYALEALSVILDLMCEAEEVPLDVCINKITSVQPHTL